jgi:hypothetical protein
MAVACSTYGDMRNSYTILVGKLEGKCPLERPRRRWEDNINMDLREIGFYGVDGNEPSGSIKCGEFLD